LIRREGRRSWYARHGPKDELMAAPQTTGWAALVV